MRRLHPVIPAIPAVPVLTCLSLALFLASPALALPPPGPPAAVKWELPQMQVITVGEMAADAGLEFIGMNALGSMGLYRLGTGTQLANLPNPFNDVRTVFTLRDVDNDGRAEILCLNDNLLGMLDYGSSLVRKWPDLLLNSSTFDVTSLVDFMNLSAGSPQVIVMNTTFKLALIDAVSGAVVYDTEEDPAIPAELRVDSVLVDDFDLDGYDDVLLTVLNSSTDDKLIYLIGAGAGLSSVNDLSGPGLVKLQQSWPNPVNGSSTIRFELERTGHVRLRIFDAAGRLVRTIADDQMPAGSHTRVWDGRDQQDRDVASGIYFYELDVEGQRQANKLVQVR